MTEYAMLDIVAQRMHAEFLRRLLGSRWRPGWLAVSLLAACASEQLALAPPPGVDFSGTWKLNQADSDDPQRLLPNQTEPGRAKASSGGSTGGGPSGGGGPPGGGRGGKRGGRSQRGGGGGGG